MVSIFTSQTPALPNVNDSLTQNLGTVFTTSANGNVTHIRWFFPTTLPTGTVIGGLWSWTSDGSGTLLGQANFVTPVAGTWNTAQLAVPIAITAGNYYVASIYSNDQYVATGALFNGVSITNGPLTAPADNPGLPRRNGKFLQAAVGLTYPTGFFNGNGYFADVVFELPAPAEIIPDGITIAVNQGAPALADASMAIAPNSITVAVNQGAPTLSQDLAIVPDGVTVNVSLGAPTVSIGGITPDGITIPVALGPPEVEGPPAPGALDLVSSLFDALLACLRSAVTIQPNPPAHISPRVGTEVVYDLGQYSDLCCEGLAYTMLGDTWLSSDSFPDQEVIRQIRGSCAPPTWAQEFKMGIVRCSPTGQEDGEPPTDAEWTAASIQNLIDAQTLRQASCCFRDYIVTTLQGTIYDGMSVVINRQIQANPQGGCVERFVSIVVQFPNLECFCG